ncbi:MAG TPA: hypothetical protein VJB67_02485 [Patescibacteria group bacterium]|nr:hypothetical protein [Patescibacteria group bacterium]
MNLYKKLFLSLALGIYLFVTFLILPAKAQARPEVYFFFSPTCHVCAEEKIFLDQLAGEFPDLIINRFDLTRPVNFGLLREYYQRYEVPADKQGSTPATFIDLGSENGRYFIGYGPSLDSVIKEYILTAGQTDNDGSKPFIPVERKFSLPFIGEVDISGFSPLMLSVAVGVLDGFNACAMVALGFLLAVLVSSGMRRKVFIVGGVFILVSGAVYYLFISAWLNLFLFLGYLQIITTVISIIIILFALFLLKDYISGVVCKICDVPAGKEGFFTRAQRKLFIYMSRLTTIKMSLPLMLLGVALVAIGINTVELFCSFGFPLAYTKILTSYDLSPWSHYFYILVYVIFYMIDDFIIFMIAVATLRITKVSDKYLKAVSLISGIVLLILGILMLFRPDLLVI